MDADFTKLQNAVRDIHEIGEIAAATGEQEIEKLITYRPHRLALFETAAIVASELRLSDEDDFLKAVQDIYRNHVRPVIKANKNLQSECELEARKIAFKMLENKNPFTLPYGVIAKELSARI